MKAAQRDLETASPSSHDEGPDEGELVESATQVTFVLLASGYCARDFAVSAGHGELRVDAPDFQIVRRLPCKVDGASLVTRYVNGVLSARLAKKD